MNLSMLLTKTARSLPDKTALIHGSKQLTYAHRNLLAMTMNFYADICPGFGPEAVTLHAVPLSHSSGLYGLPNIASYKKPKSIDFVEKLPKNNYGKILKRELRAIYWKSKDRKV